MSDDRALMAKVADLYYRRDLTQQEIAERLGLSRPTVSRLLGRARAEGIVRIEIEDESHRALERELEERFGLREAIVLPGRSEAPTATRAALGRATARYLERIVKGGERIGVSWGTTLAAAVEHVRRRALRTTVVPMVGGLGRVGAGIHANDLAGRLADLHGGRVHMLHAPAIVATPALRDALLSDAHVREALDLARTVEVALVGIGALIPSSTLVQSGYVSVDDLAALRARGAVGDICTRSFTGDGGAADPALDRRILAVELDDLRRVPTVIGVAGGLEKAEAIHGALRGRLVDVLVTDHLAARAVARADRAQEQTR